MDGADQAVLLVQVNSCLVAMSVLLERLLGLRRKHMGRTYKKNEYFVLST